ncbi:CRM-domain containing factor CFM2, chloroplastic-like isoform X2 [Zingiber officinale]|uniref:CRM-domain containing factor CFM2, chloroplastic-like isoform X2 n=1 Tax=Zingiber officinale TaxID=94328 RepID=UPI001C4D087E|nr:CRM-domain containing factor CFM2, chloroplastic-like isoform X2 [Zingiber officinale]
MPIYLSPPPPIPFSKPLNAHLLTLPRLPSPRCALPSQNPRKPLKGTHPPQATPTPQTVSQSAIQRISEKLRSLGFLEQHPPSSADDRPTTGPGSAGEIFIPTPREILTHRVGYTIDSSWSTPEHPVPQPGSGVTINRFHHLWTRDKVRKAEARARKDAEPPPTVAELTIPPEELKRLRREGVRLEKRLKIGKAGITEGIVNGIHERWRRSELVKIKCEDLCRMNMKRTHEILERKTGGLVVWRSGSIIILYRGVDYKYPCYFHEDKDKIFNETSLSSGMHNEPTNSQEASLLPMLSADSSTESPASQSRSSFIVGVGSSKKVHQKIEGELQLEEEADRLLDGLGPRFSDWWGCDPLPIDADLLPAVVPGFRKPFRLLPFGIKPKLTDREMTILKRLGRPLPCHFALGRNTNLQGLAVSMMKLWEKCEIAKIAIKRGVQNTNSVMMAEELKQLTGGTLLSRDREFFVFYRGKDFLPLVVSSAIEERRNKGNNRPKRITNENLVEALVVSEPTSSPISPPEELKKGSEQKQKFALEGTNSENFALQRIENRLSQAIVKVEMSRKRLAELETSVKPKETALDKEAISEEERYMLRKVGLRMNAFLLLGRRGVFDGTVENMHLHWKYRELVKIISKDHSIKTAEATARLLEAESGGILVAVERVSKGYAIIIYRGKNYRRPVILRPTTLPNKRVAMKRSLEAQRCESLKLHVLKFSKKLSQVSNQTVKDDSYVDSTVEHVCGLMNDIVANDSWIMKGQNDQSSGSMDKLVVLKDGDECSKLEVAIPSSAVVDENNLAKQAYEVPSETSTTIVEDKSVALKDGDKCSDSKVAVTSSMVVEDEFAVKDGDKCSDSKVAVTSSMVVEDEFAKHSYEVPSEASPVDENELAKESYDVPFKAAPLSNRERLILRKQALKMKKRPILAIGRNNIVSGVAKTIRTHFRKHPLAIVNIKGRAEGTSVQELIFELEQSTGAVLVSREPNKVILYRGWGDCEAPGGKGKNAERCSSGVKDIVSPQLLEAIKLECGLQTST